MCDMYGCTSNGTCLNDAICDCHEQYHIFEANVTSDQFRDLSLDQLWNYQFRYTNASVNLLAAVRNNSKIADILMVELRDPRKTPQDIITRLRLLFPTAADIAHLQPIQHGAVNDYVTANKSFEYEKFRRYLERKLDNLTDDVYQQLQNIQHKDTFAEIMKFVKNEDHVKYLLRQLFLFPSDFIKVFAQENGYNITEVLQHIKPQPSNASSKPSYTPADNNNNLTIVHTTEDIDEIMLSGVLEIFIELISGYTD